MVSVHYVWLIAYTLKDEATAFITLNVFVKCDIIFFSWLTHYSPAIPASVASPTVGTV